MPTSLMALEFGSAARNEFPHDARALLYFYAATTTTLLLIAAEFHLGMFTGLTSTEMAFHAAGMDLIPGELLKVL